MIFLQCAGREVRGSAALLAAGRGVRERGADSASDDEASGQRSSSSSSSSSSASSISGFTSTAAASYSNTAEAAAVVAVVRSLLDGGEVGMADIGVITPYSAQVRKNAGACTCAHTYARAHTHTVRALSHAMHCNALQCRCVR